MVNCPINDKSKEITSRSVIKFLESLSEWREKIIISVSIHSSAPKALNVLKVVWEVTQLKYTWLTNIL